MNKQSIIRLRQLHGFDKSVPRAKCLKTCDYIPVIRIHLSLNGYAKSEGIENVAKWPKR